MIVTKRDDIRTYVEKQIQPSANKVIRRVADAIRAKNHPAYGTNWDAFLSRIDLRKLIDEVQIDNGGWRSLPRPDLNGGTTPERMENIKLYIADNPSNMSDPVLIEWIKRHSNEVNKFFRLV